MKETVKVLYFVDRMLRGGIQSLVIDWVSRFDKEKIQVDFLLLDDGKKYELEETLKNLGCNVYKLKGIWIRNPLDFLKESNALNNFFKKHNDYKVVHMHSSSKNYMVLKYAKKYGIPIRIAHSHNIDFQTKNKIKKWYGNILKKQLLKYSTDCLACSTLAGEWLFGKNAKFKVIHNAIDYKKFAPNTEIRKKIRDSLNIADNEIVIGNVGRFTNQKNHIFLIDIFNEIVKIKKEVKLLLVGTGILQDKIKEKCMELQLMDKVIFSGFQKNVNDYLQAMDIFVMPSLYEGLPVSGIEAQASGLPCFMSKDVITNEVKITDTLYFISLSKSSQEWAESILNKDINRKDNYENIKKAGYLIEDVIKQLENLYLK